MVARPVTVTVTNVDEPGTVMLSTLQPQVDVEVTATLSDDDSVTVSSVEWQWYRGATPIANATSMDSLTATYTPEGGDTGQRLRARATYDDAHDENKNAQVDSSRTVRSEPSSNISPQVPTGTVEREVAENTPAGRSIGAPVVATDPGDVLTYSLGGTDEASFDIDRATGQLKTKTDLNHEDKGSYSVTVTATDPFRESANASVTIAVTDVNEAPTISGSPEATLTFAELNETTPLPTYTASDEDAEARRPR